MSLRGFGYFDTTNNIWVNAPSGDALDYTKGGTGQTTVTAQDLLFGSASNTWGRLAVGSEGQVLSVVSGILAWATISAPTQTVTSGAGASTAKLAPVYIKSDGNFAKAKADSLNTRKVFGLTAAAIADTVAGSIYVEPGTVITATTGEWDAICGTSGGLTPGVSYFLSGATAGILTATAPTTSGHVQFEVIIALSTTKAKLVLREIGMA